MDNYEIVKILQKAISLMDLHGESSQKIRTYNNAVFNLERVEERIADKTAEELQEIGGVGQGLSQTIREIVETGTFPLIDELSEQTPDGILEMLAIRGVGLAKIKTAWKEKGIVDPKGMLELAQCGEMVKLKGFGAKTVENIATSLENYLANKSKMLLNEGLEFADSIREKMREINSSLEVFPTGELLRCPEIIDKWTFLTAAPREDILTVLEELEVEMLDKESGPSVIRAKYKSLYRLEFYICRKEEIGYQSLLLSSSPFHRTQLKENGLTGPEAFNNMTEAKIYDALGFVEVPSEHREFPEIEEWKKTGVAPNLIHNEAIKGMLHCHSTYSDGRNTLREMAQACIDRGYQYLGICDHSKSAFFYANGLFENRVLQQHEEIDKINEELAPFKILKGIESDILPDGNLDYDLDFLGNFDFVVASVHSVLNMDLEKAMTRMLTAINNPHTTILGHLTGRILLERTGFPVDHKTLIDACAENEVGIEINAHPSRLDLDWRWVKYAMDKGVMISINPDAHSTDGLDMTQYGVIMGRKAGLLVGKTLNTYSLEEIEAYFSNRKKSRGITI